MGGASTSPSFHGCDECAGDPPARRERRMRSSGRLRLQRALPEPARWVTSRPRTSENSLELLFFVTPRARIRVRRRPFAFCCKLGSIPRTSRAGSGLIYSPDRLGNCRGDLPWENELSSLSPRLRSDRCLAAPSIIKGSGPQQVYLQSKPAGADVQVILMPEGALVASGKTPYMATLATWRILPRREVSGYVPDAYGSNRAKPLDTSANGWYIAGNIVFGELIG